MENTEKNDLFKTILSRYELALAPALAYFAALCYEISYCRMYNVPANFVEIDFTSILFLAFVFFGMGFTFINFLNMLVDFDNASANESSAMRLFRLYFPTAFILSTFAILFEFAWYYYIAILIGIIAIDVALALSEDKTKPFTSRLIGPAKILFSALSPGKTTIGKLYPVVISLFLLFAFVCCLGRFQAAHTTSYLVPSNHTNAIVVRKYGSKLICCEIDFSNKKPLKRIFFEDISANSNVTLEWKETGRLNFK